MGDHVVRGGPMPPGFIGGGRVRLERLRPRDAVAFWQAIEASRSTLEPWLRWPRDVRSQPEAARRIRELDRAWEARERFNWGVFDRDSGRLLGEAAIVCTDWPDRVFALAYWLQPDARGRGFALEAVALVAMAAFERLGAKRVVARADARNGRSRCFLAAFGFAEVETLPADHRGPGGALVDMVAYALTSAGDCGALAEAAAACGAAPDETAGRGCLYGPMASDMPSKTPHVFMNQPQS